MCVAVVYLHGFSGFKIKLLSDAAVLVWLQIPKAFSAGMLNLMNERPDVPGTFSLS